MSTIFKDISTVDPMPSHIDTSSRIFGCTFGRTTFQTRSGSQDFNASNKQLGNSNDVENLYNRRSRLLAFGKISSLQNRLNQEMRISDHLSTLPAPRTFGLQSRNSSSVSPLHAENNLRLNQATRTFGLASEDVNGMPAQSNERFIQEFRINGSSSSSIMPRPFGLHTKTLTSHSLRCSQGSSEANKDANLMNYRRSNLSTTSRACLRSENLGGFASHENEGFNQNLRRNTSAHSSSMLRSFSMQPRNLTLNQVAGLRMSEDSTLRNNNISPIAKTFGPAVRSGGLGIRESTRCNDDVIDNEGFRRPTLSRVIRGRSSTLTSRLFQNQDAKRYCKDLSNINGFNVSHISLRNVDVQSDSRLVINPRSNWMDNQSMTGSVSSATSLKSQFMNLLENLHHSILNIGPHLPAEALRIEFDRAKQRLEHISEMSLAPSAKENGAVSITSQSFKNTYPQIAEPTTSTCIDGGSLHLKSSNDLLKTLISGKDNYRDKFKLSTHIEEEGERRRPSSVRSSPQNNECHIEKSSEPPLKKSGSYHKNIKNSRILKVVVPQTVKNLTSMTSKNLISLKQWYPVAVGSDLKLCGVNDDGETVRTVAVKKRLNSRKVELINGFKVELIGSPSAMVSGLPKKIMTLLKNGLTDRWRVLQRELSQFQENNKEVSQTSNAERSPKKNRKAAGEVTTKKKKSNTPKVVSTPKRQRKVPEMHTRSGRAVKPPSMFWIVNVRNAEVSSTLECSASRRTPNEHLLEKTSKTASGETLPKKQKKSVRGSPSKKYKKPIKVSPKKKALDVGSPLRLKKGNKNSPYQKSKASGDASFGKSKTGDKPHKSPKKELLNGKSPKKNKSKVDEEEMQVHSSTDDAKREYKIRAAKGKRKRDVYGDVESVQAKKSKLDRKTETQVESTVNSSEAVLKKGKKKKGGLTLSTHSPKPKTKKSSSAKKKKENVKKKTESISEANELNDFEEDFELNLNDIEIPEIANVSGNPQLSRSQLRLISMETPPLKYFNTHLNLLRSATPVRSPGWCVSQRTVSEVKQFQKRREEAFKKKIKVNVKKTVAKEKSKNVQNKDVKKVIEWVAEETVRSPQWNSRVLQYVIPSRKQLEEKQMNDEEDEDEDADAEFL